MIYDINSGVSLPIREELSEYQSIEAVLRSMDGPNGRFMKNKKFGLSRFSSIFAK
jgi:hypothetical protein